MAAPITVVGPDLIVTAASVTPLAVAPGATVSVSSTVRNPGAQASGAFDVGVYLSSTHPTRPERTSSSRCYERRRSGRARCPAR